METKLIRKEGVSAKFEVTIPAADVDKMYDRVLGTIARQVKIPGFRPGKAPRGVLIKQIGQDALDQEVRDALVETTYPQAVKELELMPVHAHFHAHEARSGQDYSFEVMVDLYPEFELPDLNEIIIDTAVPELTDDMVTETIERLRSEHATLIPVERQIQAGDYIMIEMESGSAMPIDLERVAPEFAEQFLGKSIGDTLELSLLDQTRDESDDAKDDASQAAEAASETTEAETEAEEVNAEAAASDTDTTQSRKLKIVIQDIKEKEKPELDDEFAKTLGFETWSEVEAQVRTGMQAELEAEAFEAQREEFIDKLVAETTVDLPPSVVNRRKASLLQSFVEELKERNETLESYLQQLDDNEGRETFEKELQETAEQGVKRDVVLEQLLELRGATVSDDEFNQAVRYLADRRGVNVNKFRSDMGEEWLENYHFLMRRDKAVREALRELLGDNATSDETEAPASAADGAEASEVAEAESQ
jgi:trigger factor